MRTLTLLWRLGLPSLRRAPPSAGLGLRRDPAPTLWSYRYQRLMLTPAFRGLVRVGLPAVTIAVLGALWLAQPSHRAALAGAWEATLTRVQDRPEFMVARVEVTGADRSLTEALGEVLRLDLPVSSFDLDLDSIRAQVTALTAVRSAGVRIRPGGTLAGPVAKQVLDFMFANNTPTS